MTKEEIVKSFRTLAAGTPIECAMCAVSRRTLVEAATLIEQQATQLELKDEVIKSLHEVNEDNGKAIEQEAREIEGWKRAADITRSNMEYLNTELTTLKEQNEKLVRASASLLAYNGGPTTDTLDGDEYVLVRIEDFKAIEQTLASIHNEKAG